MKKVFIFFIVFLIHSNLMSISLIGSGPKENIWENDADVIAVYNVENGALTVDSKNGTYPVINYNTVVANLINYKQGTASANFVSSSSQRLSATDGSLDSNHPLESGGTGIFSICFWMRLTTIGSADEYPIAKHNPGSDKRSFAIEIDQTTSKPIARFGKSPGTVNNNSDVFGSVMTTGVWYHVVVTLDGSYNYRLSVWDDTSEALLDADVTGTLPDPIYLTDVDFNIGVRQEVAGWSGYFNGEIDEVVIFDRAITVADIALIRKGTYGH